MERLLFQITPRLISGVVRSLIVEIIKAVEDVREIKVGGENETNTTNAAGEIPEVIESLAR